MSRKEKIIDIQDREQLLTFKIKEMPATKMESWLFRAASLLASAWKQTMAGAAPTNFDNISLESKLSILGEIDYEKAEPLLNELLSCCSRMVEKVEERCTPQSVDNYILDVSTLFKLRLEAVKLNLGSLKLAAGKLSSSLENTASSGQ
jgi:predicted glycoside hydrolase/deacetylase ChbG (UPF0249 family)